MGTPEAKSLITDTLELFERMLAEQKHGSYTTKEGVDSSETQNLLRGYIERFQKHKEWVNKITDDRVEVRFGDKVRRERGFGSVEPGRN